MRIIADGPLLVWDDLFFVDSFNVFLVALTAFVAFTTSLFSRPYMRIEVDLGRLTPARLRLYHGMFQMFTFTMLLVLHHQQRGHPVGGDGGGDAHHRAAGEPLPHAGEPRGRMEVLHPVRRGSRAGALRHHPALLRGGEGAGRGRQRAPVDASLRGQGAARADRAGARVRVPAGRLRHQGRPRAAAQLAARRARRGPDAGLGGALGAAPQRGAVRGRAHQGAGRWRARHATSPAT